MVEKPLSDYAWCNDCGEHHYVGRGVEPWLPTDTPEPSQFFAVDRSDGPRRLAGLDLGDTRERVYYPTPPARWMVAALEWPLAMMAGAEHWRRRTGGTVSFAPSQAGDGVKSTWRAGDWSCRWHIFEPRDLEPTDEGDDYGRSGLDHVTLRWVDAGCPR